MDAREQLEIKRLSARMGLELTEEQAEFASDFTTPLISFSDPGTGKSHSTIAGLIMAQTYHGIPGRKINAMSFTRVATAELKARYDRACKQCHISPTVVFNTFHSICHTILKEKYPTFRIKKSIDYERDLEIVRAYMENYGLETDNMYYIRSVLETINSLNAALIYDDTQVFLSYKFKKLAMPLDIFQKIRKDWFVCGLTTKKITQGDIPVYTLYILLRNKELQIKYKEKYKIMVVDEFQDMSLLNLKVLSLISSNLVVIGDMKQQIYAFNGACQQIVDEYLKMYPMARRRDLTKSFRCSNEIADYATAIYYPNDKNVTAFTGTGEGGSVKVMSARELNLKMIVANLKAEQEKEGLCKARSSMFLFRNNYSATPVIEALYKQNVLFRANKFATIMELPIFKEMTWYIELITQPFNEISLSRIPLLFPEFKSFSPTKCPLLLAIKKSGKNVIEVPYTFKEQSSAEIITALTRVAIGLEKGKEAGIIYNIVLPLYEKYIIEGKWWKLEFKKEFYFGLAEEIVINKTFEQMVTEEYDKARINDDCTRTNSGVRCYTMHTAKGLEADDIYILDAEDVLFPSQRAMSSYIANECEYEAARDLRNERNLLYVAVTRARQNVVITYQTELTPLLASPNEHDYSYLDAIYSSMDFERDDVAAFLKLFNLEESKQKEK